MIPVYKTFHVEGAVNLLIKHVRHVQVNCIYQNFVPGRDMRVRFRADLIRDERVFFGKVSSQIDRWKERGGVLICWTWNYAISPDAVVYAECPTRMVQLWRSINAKSLAVVYRPRSWNPHETILRLRHQEKYEKQRRLLSELGAIKDYVEERRELTAENLRSLLARQERSRSSSLSAPESPAA